MYLRDLIFKLMKKAFLKEERKKGEYFTKIRKQKLMELNFLFVFQTLFLLNMTCIYILQTFFLVVCVLQWTISTLKIYTDLLRGLGLYQQNGAFKLSGGVDRKATGLPVSECNMI